MSIRIAVVGYPLLSVRQWRLYTELEKRDAEIHLLVPHSWPTIPAEEHPGPGESISVHHHRTIFDGYPMRYLMPGMIPTINRVNPDVVLTHGEPWAAITVETEVACELTNAQHLVFSWENLERVPHHPLQRVTEKRTLSWVDGTIAGSDAARDRLQTRGFEGSITVAPQTGVDVNKFQPTEVSDEQYDTLGVDPDAPVILYAGRLAPEKGITDLLDAVPHVIASRPDVQFLLVGDGEMTSEIERRVADESLGSVSLITEKQSYNLMPTIHSAATVFTYPSRTTSNWAEQFGYSVAEAMACGIPVVTTECGSLPYVVGDGGIVCPERSPDDLGTAIIELLNDPERRDRISAAARDRVQSEFSIQEVAESQYQAMRGIVSSTISA